MEINVIKNLCFSLMAFFIMSHSALAMQSFEAQNARRVQCSLCPKNYAKKSGLVKHIKVKHPESLLPSRQPSYLDELKEYGYTTSPEDLKAELRFNSEYFLGAAIIAPDISNKSYLCPDKLSDFVDAIFEIEQEYDAF